MLGVSILDTLTPANSPTCGCWRSRQGLKLKSIARMIAPYPTLGEANKAVAGEFYKPKVFGDFSRRVVGWFKHLP